MDSSKLLIFLLAVHIRVVLALPPRDSLSKKVNLESLKGTWLLPSVKLLMHIPKEVKLRLIFLSSSNYLADTPHLLILSLPARSTKLSLACFIEPSGFFCKYSITNMVWLLELLSFRLVDDIALFCWPIINSSNMSSGHVTYNGSQFNTTTWPFFCSLSLSPLWAY